MCQAAGVGVRAIGIYPGPELGELENTSHTEPLAEKHHSVGEKKLNHAKLVRTSRNCSTINLFGP